MVEGIATLTVLAWLAYLASRLFKRREVPELVSFLLVGAVLGPSGFKFISQSDLQQLRPLTEIALSVLMFLIGERLSRRALHAMRWVPLTGILQYLLAGAAVFVATSALGTDPVTALLLATVAGAGAPMTIASIISSTRVRNRYSDGLLGTHAVSDAMAALFFAAALPIAILMRDPDPTVLTALVSFLRRGVGGAVLGAFFGWVIAKLGRQIETSSEMLLFVLTHVLLAWTVSFQLRLSLPLVAIIMGAVAASLAEPDAAQRTFVAVRSIEQPLYLIFFALAGASVHLEAVPALGLVGLVYIVVRTGAKLVGGTLGGIVGGLPMDQAKRLGIDLVPQAGVAVGLAVLAAERLPGPGNDMATVVLGSVVIFELVGPIVVGRGLVKMKQEAREKDRERRVHYQEVLPSRVLVAGPNSVSAPAWIYDWCERFNAELAVLSSGKNEDDQVALMRNTARSRSIPFRWIEFKGESFVGETVRAAENLGADLVAVVTPLKDLKERSRLLLHPHERIARGLSCPVMFLPFDS